MKSTQKAQPISSYLAIPVIVTTILLTMLLTTNGLAANFPLEITNIKPAETGSPAIPSTNRIFKAYPGIEYNIRAAVIGGLYPFTYSLSNAPEGMTINNDTGEISWPNPQSDSGTISLTVTDAEKTTVSTTWAIQVTTSGFLFVDPTYAGTQTGSISQPFSMIANLLKNTTSANRTDVVYFRGGNYTLPAHNSIYKAIPNVLGCNLSNRPFTWIGYPGETVNIDAAGRFLESSNVYFDSLNLSNFSDYGIRASSKASYNTIRRTTWSNIEAVRSVNANQGFYFAAENGIGYYLVFQDNTFTKYTGAHAIGSLYQTHKALIENNYMHDGGYIGLNYFSRAIGAKYDCDRLTVRGNKIVMPSNTLVNLYLSSDDVEIAFNLMHHTGGGTTFESTAKSSTFPGVTNIHIYRNTIIGGNIKIASDPCGTYSHGPYHFSKNTLILEGSGLYTYDSCNALNISNNLEGSSSDNIVDSKGNLTEEYLSYLGTMGHQTKENITNPTPPPTTSPNPPTNLIITSN